MIAEELYIAELTKEVQMLSQMVADLLNIAFSFTPPPDKDSDEDDPGAQLNAISERYYKHEAKQRAKQTMILKDVGDVHNEESSNQSNT